MVGLVLSNFPYRALSGILSGPQKTANFLFAGFLDYEMSQLPSQATSFEDTGLCVLCALTSRT